MGMQRDYSSCSAIIQVAAGYGLECNAGVLAMENPKKMSKDF